MKTMKWILGAVVATAILAPLQSANAWGGDGYGGGGYDETRHGDYRGGDYDGGDRSHYRGHRGYYRAPNSFVELIIGWCKVSPSLRSTNQIGAL